MSAKICLVVTTISDGFFLDAYANKLIEEEMTKDAVIIVIPDRKSPPQLFEKCKQLGQQGIRVMCPTLEAQDQFLSKLGGIQHITPYNSNERRTVGFLMALEVGCEFLITIDDDNFCRGNESFFAEHIAMMEDTQEFEVVHSHNGWFNICDMMEIVPDYRVYARGFPYSKHYDNAKVVYPMDYTTESGLIKMNAGLWLAEPDLDSITWLVAPVKAKSFNGESLVLGEDAWSPINTQNTALHRDVIVSYYYVRMDYPLAGIPIDRYGDIFSGYFSQAVIRHMGHRIRVGSPIVDHDRNTHDFMQDAYRELACIWVLEDLLEWLPGAKLEGSTYEEAYISLSYAIEDIVEQFSGFIWTDASRGYFHQMAHRMRTWVKAVRIIEGK